MNNNIDIAHFGNFAPVAAPAPVAPVENKAAKSLMLHCGAREVTFDEVVSTYTPAPTKSHFPIPHRALVDTVKQSLGTGGYEIESEAHSLNKEGAQYFGAVALRSTRSDLGFVVGIRNSHDKSLVAGLAAGTRVFVCDNMAFSGSINVARKHTRFIVRDLSALAMRAVTRLGDMFEQETTRIEAMQNTRLTDMGAHDLVVRMVDSKIIPAVDMMKVVGEWRKPQHVEFEERNVWSLYNAVTEVAKRWKNPNTLAMRTGALGGMMAIHTGVELAS